MVKDLPETLTLSSQTFSSLIVLPLAALAMASASVGYMVSPMEAAGAEMVKGLKPLVVKVT